MPPPVIALDATYAVEHPRHPLTGVGVYSREILHGLAARHTDARFRWCYRPHRFLRGRGQPHPANAIARPLLERWVPACDVFHGLNQRLPTTRLRRAVTTFHDLFVMTSDEYSSPDFRARFTAQARHAAERSDLILAVSAFTAEQVASLLHFDRARIRVVHHGVRLPPPSATARKPVILSVGALQRRKNTAALIEAFNTLDAPDWRLVLAGSHGYGAEDALSAIARSPKRAAIETPGFITDAERHRLYAEAAIFAFPSLEEGFGMPVLEAMAHGLPVVTSTTSSLPEVAGDAALLVDPRDTAAIVRALQRLVDDAALRTEYAARGLAHARLFTWEKAADATWAAYQHLLGGK